MVVGYCRVSTNRQAVFGISLEAQAEKIRSTATAHGIELSEIIVDAGESARNLHRPGMERLLRMVDARTVKTVVIASLSRLTRSVSDLALLLDNFRRHNVTLVSVQESLDTGSTAGRLVMNIMCSVSQWEREILSERTKDAMQQKKLNGERVGNIPFGYRLADDLKHVAPEPEEQRVISAMVRLKRQGLSLRSIAADLNSQGYTTRSGTAWHHVYVSGVLKSATERNRIAA
jgi:site-specific DNA recombinase